jgi:hypothetical protein
MQRLIFAGKQLEDDDILLSCGVRSGDLLQFVLVSAGAAPLQTTPAGTPLRMTPAVEEISALPKLKLTRPPRSCVDELRRPDLLPHVPAMADLLEDVSFKVQQLMYETDVPVELPPDELFAVVSYTYDNQTGAQVCDHSGIAPASRLHPDCISLYGILPF